MNDQTNPSIDPMREGHPEPFSEPRTIPTGWDLSELLPKPSAPTAKPSGVPFLLLNQDGVLSQDRPL